MENMLSIKTRFNYFMTLLIILIMVIGLQKESIAENSPYFENVFHEFSIELDSAQDVTNQESEIVKKVERMPRFPGCEDVSDDVNEIMVCAEQKMLEFVYKNLKYPEEARQDSIQGQEVVTFTVSTKGEIVNPHVLRDIGGGCGDEALRVIKLMNEMEERWIPGIQRGQYISVQFNLPIVFWLE